MTSLVLEASLRAACVLHTGLWFLGPAVSGEGQTGSWGPGLLPRSSAVNSVGGPGQAPRASVSPFVNREISLPG